MTTEMSLSGIGPHVVAFPDVGVFRVARREEPLAMSWITAADTEGSTGNRYDVAGGGVLYCATDLECCYAETLGRFRPSPKMLSVLGRHEDGRMNTGSVPADWRMRRVKGRVQCSDPLPFVDVEHQATLAYLNEELAKDLAALDVDRPLDVSHVRGGNRSIPRLLSRWAYVQQDENGNPHYSGIRYKSKFGDWECWAVFDGNDTLFAEPAAISLDDEALQRVGEMFGLTLH